MSMIRVHFLTQKLGTMPRAHMHYSNCFCNRLCSSQPCRWHRWAPACSGGSTRTSRSCGSASPPRSSSRLRPAAVRHADACLTCCRPVGGPDSLLHTHLHNDTMLVRTCDALCHARPHRWNVAGANLKQSDGSVSPGGVPSGPGAAVAAEAGAALTAVAGAVLASGGDPAANGGADTPAATDRSNGMSPSCM